MQGITVLHESCHRVLPWLSHMRVVLLTLWPVWIQRLRTQGSKCPSPGESSEECDACRSTRDMGDGHWNRHQCRPREGPLRIRRRMQRQRWWRSWHQVWGRSPLPRPPDHRGALDKGRQNRYPNEWPSLHWHLIKWVMLVNVIGRDNEKVTYWLMHSFMKMCDPELMARALSVWDADAVGCSTYHSLRKKG